MREGLAFIGSGRFQSPGRSCSKALVSYVSALAFRALAIIAPAGKSVPVLAI